MVFPGVVVSRSVPLLLVPVLFACGGGGDSPTDPDAPSGVPACTSAPPLTAAPVPASSIREVAPLGNLNPPGHVFPTDHIYFYSRTVSGGSESVPVVSPGRIRIVAVEQSRRTSGTTTMQDHGIRFFPCADVVMVFGHVTTLSPSLAARVGAFTTCDPPYTTGGVTNQLCRKDVDIELAAGEAIGTMGGPLQGALDLGAYDRRNPPLAFVNPARSWGYGEPFGQAQTACPLDYLVPAARDAFLPLLGVAGVRRTAEPLCGTILWDVAGTARGRWYNGPSYPEDPHLGLVMDSGDPAVAVFSVGTSIPTINRGLWRFTPQTSGRANLAFERVTPDGQVYCYQTVESPVRRILLQLTSATQLRIEGGTGNCTDPATFVLTGAATTFVR